MIPEDEARHTVEFDDIFVIQPDFHWWSRDLTTDGGRPCPDGFSYSSDSNTQWLTTDQIRQLADSYAREHGLA